MTSARTIAKALGGMRAGSYWLVRCPAHDDHKPSCKIKDDANKSDGIDVHCFAGCSWQEVKSELQRQGLLDGESAALTTHNRKIVCPEFRTKSNGRPVKIEAVPKQSAHDVRGDNDLAQRIEYALSLWDQCVPLIDTLGWRYFTERRGLHIGTLDLDHCLRWHEGIAAVIALMTDPISNEPVGIHRTFLNPDGTKRERKMLGKTGVIRLSRNEDVHEGLGLSEGIEDGLSVLLSGWAPVWAAASAGAIERFPVLSGVQALTIFSDYDEAGMNAAVACCDRWEAVGREVAIQEPEQEKS
jgi:hypothetical protein